MLEHHIDLLASFFFDNDNEGIEMLRLELVVVFGLHAQIDRRTFDLFCISSRTVEPNLFDRCDIFCSLGNSFFKLLKRKNFATFGRVRSGEIAFIFGRINRIDLFGGLFFGNCIRGSELACFIELINRFDLSETFFFADRIQRIGSRRRFFTRGGIGGGIILFSKRFGFLREIGLRFALERNSNPFVFVFFDFWGLFRLFNFVGSGEFARDGFFLSRFLRNLYCRNGVGMRGSRSTRLSLQERFDDREIILDALEQHFVFAWLVRLSIGNFETGLQIVDESLGT